MWIGSVSKLKLLLITFFMHYITQTLKERSKYVQSRLEKQPIVANDAGFNSGGTRMGVGIREGMTAAQALRAMQKDPRAMRGKAQAVYYSLAMGGIRLVSMVLTAAAWQSRLGAGAWVSSALGFFVTVILGILLVQRGNKGLLYLCFFSGLLGLLIGIFSAFTGAQAHRVISAGTIMNLILDAAQVAGSVYLLESKPAKRFFRGMQAVALVERNYRI